MMLRLFLALVATLASIHPVIGDTEPDLPGIDGQITMLYYEDMAAATRFYGESLGLEKALDWDWVRFFRTTPTTYVGLVESGKGHHTAQPSNAVMVSLVTSNIDGWHQRLAALDGIDHLKPLAERGPIKSFMLKDPGGYTVEFFQWLETPEEMEND